jgi:hypothetical protein
MPQVLSYLGTYQMSRVELSNRLRIDGFYLSKSRTKYTCFINDMDTMICISHDGGRPTPPAV